MKTLILLLLVMPLTTFAQSLDVDLADYCKESLEREIDGLNCDTVPPVIAEQEDETGKKWKIRFHFGYSITKYDETDLCIESDIITTTLKDLQMIERRSNSHYNPKTWNTKHFLKWIDEPTNTFALTFEKNKNVFFFTAFHPKYLKSLLYKETVVEGKTQLEFGEIGENKYFNQPLPAGYSLLYIGNTHRNMMWQLGYGRQIDLMNSKKFGKLSYTPRLDVGITTGEARSVRVIPGVVTNDFIDKPRVQGFNASIGHRVEYQKGKVSVFVDQKFTHSEYEHGFYDGKVMYKLNSSPLTFGMGVDILSGKKKRTKL